MASRVIIATTVLLCFLLHLLPHFPVRATTISGSNSSSNDAGHRDIDCLKSIKSSIVLDPLNRLTSWDFDNDTNAGLCKFPGIDCWHASDNKVLGIHLPNLGLAGEFPRGIENCDSITSLNLSGNQLSGQIPSDIATMLPFLTILDLSNNNLSGEIPASLFNCSYLNVVRLDKNRLTGRIPDGIHQLDRLRNFSVSHNLLSGRIPAFERMQGIWAAGSFVNNSGLCGGPLDPCSPSPGPTKASQFLGFFRNGFIVGFAAVELSVLIYVYWFYIRNSRGKNKAGVGICRPVADYGRGRNVKVCVIAAIFQYIYI
ncbi:unnamed protein product [Linum tenue]|uniref:Leucine-rich repeat-containing N-terminal plant-type domain-containing protein n=2 Tax=Linum tenue TaxID=586396 RepID=A0AAV0NK41_9ROSI|nr:unnamed protein product [Linum tenue]